MYAKKMKLFEMSENLPQGRDMMIVTTKPNKASHVSVLLSPYTKVLYNSNLMRPLILQSGRRHLKVVMVFQVTSLIVRLYVGC